MRKLTCLSFQPKNIKEKKLNKNNKQIIVQNLSEYN